MIGFGLFIGHLVGDYILQNDWMASRKTTQSWPCTVHCFFYSLSIWAFSLRWMPWWGIAICFVAHWPIDRFRLARVWMRWMGQETFATGVFAPWSIIVVDNTFHLFTLWVIALLAGVS